MKLTIFQVSNITIFIRGGRKEITKLYFDFIRQKTKNIHKYHTLVSKYFNSNSESTFMYIPKLNKHVDKLWVRARFFTVEGRSDK